MTETSERKGRPNPPEEEGRLAHATIDLLRTALLKRPEFIEAVVEYYFRPKDELDDSHDVEFEIDGQRYYGTFSSENEAREDAERFEEHLTLGRGDRYVDLASVYEIDRTEEERTTFIHGRIEEHTGNYLVANGLAAVSDLSRVFPELQLQASS